MDIQVSWSEFKTRVSERNLSIQYAIMGVNYYIVMIDGYFTIQCIIPLDPTNPDTADFESNFKDSCNQSLKSQVVTQYELNDKDLKLARCKVNITNNTGTLYLKVPGSFGDGQGRYVAGGEAIIDEYDADDYACVYIEDKDRVICSALGLANDGTADVTIQGMGVLPGPLAAFGALPNYPILRSYTDDEMPAEQQGWYFYAEAQGNNLPPYGIIDIEPIGGYGFLPSALYLKIVVNRPNVVDGNTRINIFWGKKE